MSGGGGDRTGLASAILSEVAENLLRFVRDGQRRSIDLRSLPMTDLDRAELEARLGRGEVVITLSVAGPSQAWETQYAGVWWVRHAGADGQTLAETLEVASVPEVVVSPAADILAACQRLGAEVSAEAAQPARGYARG